MCSMMTAIIIALYVIIIPSTGIKLINICGLNISRSSTGLALFAMHSLHGTKNLGGSI